MGAAGWHICFDVLDHLLSGTPIGRMVGPEAMKFGGWQRLNAEYAKQFGVEAPNWPPQVAQKSRRRTGGPLKPAFGLSGRVRRSFSRARSASAVAVIVNGVAVMQGKYSSRLGLSAVFVLALQFFTGLYLFALPYAARWGSRRRTD
jgi:hypothetical protein